MAKRSCRATASARAHSWAGEQWHSQSRELRSQTRNTCVFAETAWDISQYCGVNGAAYCWLR
eukprot:15445401-Alexandrium_andersonii.AAC.1